MDTNSTGDQRGIVLVGHGAVARDCPRDMVTRLKMLEGRRRASGAVMCDEERALDARVRDWPRTPHNDPYRAGLEALAACLRPLLAPARLAVAYNEFCAPTIAAAVEDMIGNGVTDVLVVPSMMTPGGIHSEVEIPEVLADLRNRFPIATVRYAWPFDLGHVAEMLAAHLDRFA